MLQPLIVIGAGGFGRETADVVRAINSVTAKWDLKGYLDDDPSLVGNKVGDLPVIGPIDSVDAHPEAALVLCTGRPDNYASRQRIAARLGLPDERYATLIHPSVAIGPGSPVGVGSVFLSHVSVTTDVQVGRHVVVMPHCVLTHDVRLGDYVTLASGVLLGGGARIEDGAYLGSGACIREQVTVGAGAMVGMGSVVTRDVPPGRLWFGAPARDRSAAPPADRPDHPSSIRSPSTGPNS